MLKLGNKFPFIEKGTERVINSFSKIIGIILGQWKGDYTKIEAALYGKGLKYNM